MSTAALPADPPNPYVGPRSFREGEHLFGRDQELDDLTDVVTAQRLVLLYSPSGAGKSSLLEAALRPRLRDEDFWVPPTIRVGAEPPPDLPAEVNRYRLAMAVSLASPADSAATASPAELVDTTCEEMLGGLEAAEAERAGDGRPRDLCLFFDQFEELFTLDPTDGDAKEQFLGELGDALRNRGRWALFAMREDYIARLDPYIHLIPTRLNERFRLELLGRGAARQAIQGPAEEAGVEFTDAAAEKLLDELCRVRAPRGGPDDYVTGPTVEPVHLQVVCKDLWESLGS